MFNKTFILYLYFLFNTFFSVKCNLIKTTTGLLRGKLNYFREISYNSYEGIPFAEPPLGDLRFMPPVPKKPWKNILNAFTPGAVCPQVENSHVRSEMDEDCLFLNIYVPNTASTKLLPVVFFVHGGYYIVNSGKPEPTFGPELILENELIVVTTNYRLGALGFLSFGDKDASGNAGLKDILLASKWIKSNIIKFGGNPNQICYYGSGVGGALGHYLLLTKQSSGIFNNAILSSGSAIGYRSLQLHPKENALKLARELGIKNTDSNFINKLKEIDPFTIVDAEINIIRNDPRRAFSLVNFFSPTVEKPSSIALITRNPLDIIRTDGLIQRIPIITGFNNNEGLEIFSVLRDNPKEIDALNENFELCIPPNIQYPLGSRESKKLAASIRELYFSSRNISIFNTQNYINLITDTAYSYSIDYWIKLYKSQKNSSPIYYYIFQFDGQLNWGKIRNGITYSGANRGDEFGYVFLTNITKTQLQDLDYRSQYISKSCLSIMKNFATFAYPDPETYKRFLWKESGPIRCHTVIDNKFINVDEPPLQDRLGFWYREYEKYYQYEQRIRDCV